MNSKQCLYSWVGLCALLLHLTSCSANGSDPTVSSSAQTQALPQTQAPGPRSVILFVGDGMGISTVTAARIFAGQQLGLAGEEHELAFERFPHVALIKTYTTDFQVPDSAGTMTALVTGQKTRSGVLSVDASVARGDCKAANAHRLPTLLEQAETNGLRTGVISTTRITHATPAATFAHSADREWEDDSALAASAVAAGCVDIARQMLSLPQGDGVDLMLGGGRANFMPKGAVDPEYDKPLGRRADQRDLIEQWRGAQPLRRYVWNRADFRASLSELQPGKSQLLGLFEPSHMQWEADRDAEAEPSLAEMTGAAIDFLAADNTKGYFLMVEAGRIDHGHHMGNAYRALMDTVALDQAVATAVAKVDPAQTLMIVTADHSHTLTISGYPARGNPILGKAALADGRTMPDGNGNPYPTLGYANGPGALTVAEDRSKVDTADPDYRQPAAIPMTIETHAGEDVAAYAIGPNAAAVRGVMEQNHLYDVMFEALFGANRL
ncbi:MAG: alkaline phosphatase [Pseudomonadales bacterium]